MEMVRFRVLQEEVPEVPSPEEAPRLARALFFEFPERSEVGGFQDPLHHFFIGRGRQVDSSGGGSAAAYSEKVIVRIFFSSINSEEIHEPALLENPRLRARPESELLAVIPEDGDSAPLLDVCEVDFDLVERLERNKVAELLIYGKDP